MKMDEHLKQTLENSEVVSITGRRGSGKSSLGYSILEHNFKPNAYVIGLDEQYKHLLPENITVLPMNIETLESLPSHATIFSDESAFYLYARDSGKPLNKLISKIVMDARKLDQLFVFATHTYRKFEIGAILDVDALLFREPSILHARFERKEILDMVKTAKREFDKIVGDKHRYAYLISQDYEGMLEVELPSFWTEELSHAVASVIESNKSLNRNTPKHINMATGEIVLFTEGEKKLKEQIEKQFPEIEVIKIECIENVKVKANIKSEYQNKYISKSFTIVAPKKLKIINQEIQLKLDSIHTVESVFDHLIGKDVYLKAEDKSGIVITAIGETVFVKADEEFKWCDKEEFEVR